MFDRGNACKVSLGYNIRRSKFGEWGVREIKGACSKDSNALSNVYNINVLPFAINLSASSCPTPVGTVTLTLTLTQSSQLPADAQPTGVGHDDAETLIAKGRTLTL